MQQNILRVLEALGLSDGERRVYLALLELGETSSGPLAYKAKVSASKVYQVLDRLSQKGLVGISERQGKKHFKSIHPHALLDYVDDRAEKLAQVQQEAALVLPQLVSLFTAKQRETEVQLFQGMRSLRNVFYEMIADLQKGEEYHVIGAHVGEHTQSAYRAFFKQYHKDRAKKGVKAKLLYQQGVEPFPETFALAAVRFLPPEFRSPLQINLYKDKVIFLLLSEDPIIMLLQNSQVAAGFEEYFETLWKQDTRLLHNKAGVQAAVDAYTNVREDLYLIGATGLLPELYPDLYEQIEVHRKNHKLRRYHLSREWLRDSPFEKSPMTQTLFLPDQFLSPMVIWVYGDFVVNALWEKKGQTFLITENKAVAKEYRNYYELLKSFAEKDPRNIL
jgi:HTH-type transcriptional regulator, sugar sensing transcriptional regulator